MVTGSCLRKLLRTGEASSNAFTGYSTCPQQIASHQVLEAGVVVFVLCPDEMLSTIEACGQELPVFTNTIIAVLLFIFMAYEVWTTPYFVLLIQLLQLTYVLYTVVLKEGSINSHGSHRVVYLLNKNFTSHTCILGI